MKIKYPLNLLNSSEFDSHQVGCSHLEKETISELAQYFTATLNEIKAAVTRSSIESNEESFETTYRQAHVIANIASIYNLPKIGHLLAILEFICDSARNSFTFKQHSFDYLINILADTSFKILDDYEKANVNNFNACDIVDECKTYLTPVFEKWNLEEPEFSTLTEQIDSVDNELVSSSTQLTTDSENSEPSNNTRSEDFKREKASSIEVKIKDIPFGDEPENLDIPIDKLGIISEFYEENIENTSHIGRLLVELESSEDQKPIINEIFRLFHGCKGGARLLRIKKMEFVTHALEGLLDLMRKDKLSVSSQTIDILIDGKTAVEAMLEEVASRGPLITRLMPIAQKINDLGKHEDSLNMPKTCTKIGSDSLPAEVATITEVANKSTSEESQKKPSRSEENKIRVSLSAQRSRPSETIRINSEKLDELLNTASEIFITRIRFQNEISSIKQLLKSFKMTLSRSRDTSIEIPHIQAENHVAVDIDKNSDMTLHEELNLNYLTIDEIQKQLQKNLETLEHLSARLQTGAMSFRMVPISHLFERFPIQVREMARNLGKKVRVEIKGGDTELDKVLINRLADPFLHMLRNSLDHGIEMPEERIKMGKPETGFIQLNTYYHGSYAVIEINDDGKGIDVENVFSKAVEKQLVDPSMRHKLSDKEIFDFIFLPGFSTASKVTEVSGRGVGMDVVKTAVNQLQGTIEIESALGKGTTICLKLPLTLAIVRILLVQESSLQFALPILNVEEILTAKKEQIKKVGERLLYDYRGETIPMTALSSILDFSLGDYHKEDIHIVVITEGKRKLALMVDEVLGRQEILVKNLGNYLKKAPFVMGCTILRDSKLVLILDPSELMSFYLKSPLKSLDVNKMSHSHSIRRQYSILAIDDSNIQRDHLKQMFKSAGYTIDTAENGFEALKACRNKMYSAFCVDVVMPLMDGYEFIERLRKIEMYKNTPVFLVTVRDSELDKQRAAALNVTKKFTKPVEERELISVVDSYLLKKPEAEKQSNSNNKLAA